MSRFTVQEDRANRTKFKRIQSTGVRFAGSPFYLMSFKADATPDQTAIDVRRSAAQAIIVNHRQDSFSFLHDYEEIASPIYSQSYASVNQPDDIDELGHFEPGFDRNCWQFLRLPTSSVLHWPTFRAASV